MPPPEPEIAPDDSIPARFEAVAAALPGQPALLSRGQVWSYAELNRAANRVAHALLEQPGDDDAPVALIHGHHAPVIAALLGVLKAGRAYVCLDPGFPLERNAALLADSGARLILCDQARLDVAAALAGRGHTVMVQEDLHGGLPTTNPGVPVRADMDLGLFYTSGSTGTPKGVIWQHHLCLHRMAVDRLLAPVAPADRLTLLTPLTFPAATSDVFWALLNGGGLCLYDIRALGTAGLPDWLRDLGITCLRAPVALFRHLLDALEAGPGLPSLRRLTLSGDTLFGRDLARARRCLAAGVDILHRYSMSEAGLVCQNIVRDGDFPDEGVVPVGRPVPGKAVRLIDADGGSPPSGDGVGEIAVSSRHLAAGYRGGHTDDRFGADPERPGRRLYRTGDLGRFRPDGRLEFLGRLDHRLKIRGYRVEVAAIEAALLAEAEVEAAAVVAWPDASGEKSLVAHVVPADPGDPDFSGLRRRLALKLPDYMLPARFVAHAALPLTPGGKIDRPALAVPAPETRPPAAPPDGAIEARIAAIWRAALGLEAVGRDDDFFCLGGHSLLAARVLAEIHTAFGRNLPLAAFYGAPTVARLAALMGADAAAPASAGPRQTAALAEALARLEKF